MTTKTMQYRSQNNNNEIIINSSTLIYNLTDLNKSFSYSGGEKSLEKKKKEKSFIFKKLCKLGFGKNNTKKRKKK